MKAITQFEEFLEGLVEGSFRRLFRGRLEPVDLARRLGRVMDDNKRVTWGRPLVPNQYQLTLSAGDFSDIEGVIDSLSRELEKFAAERAAERGYVMPAAPLVTIVSDPTLAAATFHVRATLIDAPLPTGIAEGEAADEPNAIIPVGAHTANAANTNAGLPPDLEEIGQTRPMRPLEMPLGPTGYEPLQLVGEVNRQRVNWPVLGARTTIGRGLDNDVVLEDASVSRHHAEIIREAGRLEVRDLGSRNGTWVNAARVAASSIGPGDQLAFGAVQLEVARRSE